MFQSLRAVKDFPFNTFLKRVNKQALKFSEDPRSGLLTHTHTHNHTHRKREREREVNNCRA